MIGVASTAPGYSLAARSAWSSARVGLQAPAIMWVAFVPMLLVATAYYCMNRVDPDCGTTFTWATRALGPVAGWIGGWAIIVADIVVMANLAQIAGLYTFLLVRRRRRGSEHVLGDVRRRDLDRGHDVICWIGIELSARTAVVPARGGDHHARDLRGRRADQGLRSAIRRRTRSTLG